MTIALFGLPGTGKTYVADIFKYSFGFFGYEADVDLPKSMKHALLDSLPVTNSMRNEFMNNIIDRLHILRKKHSRLVVTQTFLKEKYRKNVLNTFSDAIFILIETKTAIREKRLKERKMFPLNQEYTQKMIQNFDSPTIPHYTINNNEDGTQNLTRQIEMLLKQLGAD